MGQTVVSVYGGMGKSVLRVGSGTNTVYHGYGASTYLASSQNSVSVVLFRRTVRTVFACHANLKAPWKKSIIESLTDARNSAPERLIDELLFLCSTEGGPDGLDMAIDILAKTKQLVLDYAWDYLGRDPAKWMPDSIGAKQRNDDYWYILLRAVGRTDADKKDRLRLITLFAGDESRGIRESVVEALGDLRTPEAKKALRRLKGDADPFIRKIAGEALTDLES
jgi:hypothetical protein